MRVILKQPEFNGKKLAWEFYLVGNKFDSSGYMDGEIESQKHHGEKSLVYAVNNYKIYARTWSDVFADFELRHKFLYDKLMLERENLVTSNKSADQIIEDLDKSTAIQPPEVTIPQD